MTQEKNALAAPRALHEPSGVALVADAPCTAQPHPQHALVSTHNAGAGGGLPDRFHSGKEGGGCSVSYLKTIALITLRSVRRGNERGRGPGRPHAGLRLKGVLPAPAPQVPRDCPFRPNRFCLPPMSGRVFNSRAVGVDTILWLDPRPQKKAQMTTPPKSYRDRTPGPGGVPDPKFGKNEKGVLESARRGGSEKASFAMSLPCIW